jgi:hypothetical protein
VFDFVVVVVLVENVVMVVHYKYDPNSELQVYSCNQYQGTVETTGDIVAVVATTVVAVLVKTVAVVVATTVVVVVAATVVVVVATIVVVVVATTVVVVVATTVVAVVATTDVAVVVAPHSSQLGMKHTAVSVLSWGPTVAAAAVEEELAHALLDIDIGSRSNKYKIVRLRCGDYYIFVPNSCG